MSTLSPASPPMKMETFEDVPPTARSRDSSTAGGGLVWTANGPMLRMEDAVVETVVTHTTRTTTSFAPIPLPRIPQPETLPLPTHLPPDLYPLAHEPTPSDMLRFPMNLGGQRVLVQDEGSVADESESSSSSSAGWRRILLNSREAMGERISVVQALNGVATSAKGKERKRPYDFSRPGSRQMIANAEKGDQPTPPMSANHGEQGHLFPLVPARQHSPPRKRVRGLEELSIPHDGSNALLSPLPSPEHEGPTSGPSTTGAISPAIGSGFEVAALFSLPSIVANFETLPDKLQQHVLMQLLRRSRMPTIQRVTSFASTALKRDFISLLPHEVAIQILKKVDTKSLVSATRVCKKWRKMIDSERVVWRQRLVDDDLWYGLGVEEEEEALMQRRMETVEWKKRAEGRAVSKAGTPIEDEPMMSAAQALPQPQQQQQQQQNEVIENPAALKHVYRRRHTSNNRWIDHRPEHMSFPGHGTNVVTCLQFDADKIVSASDDHSINVYNISTGQLRKRLDGHEGGVWALEYKGDTLVSGSTDRTVRIWDLEGLQEAHVFHGHTSTVRCLQIVEPVLDEQTGEYQPPMPYIITGSRDASLRVWKLPKKGEVSAKREPVAEDEQLLPERNPWHVHLLEGHTSAVRALAAHGRICVSGSYDTTVRVWDIVKGTCIHVLTGHEAKVYSIVYDRYRNRCASGSLDNTVKVWDVSTGECLHTLTGHTSLVGLLGISPNHLVSAAADASLRVWDANTHELKHTLASHGGAITCFQHDESKVVSGSDGTLKLWDMRTGQYVRDLVIGISSVWQVAFNGNLLVAASNRQGNTVFDVFDFGKMEHVSGVDDDSLDRLRRPPWERGNPREPRAYQTEMDDGEMAMALDSATSPRGAGDMHSPRNMSLAERLGLSSSHNHNHPSRRSSRLAARHTSSSTARYFSNGSASSSSYALDPPPPPSIRIRSSTRRSSTHRGGTGAGASGSGGSAGVVAEMGSPTPGGAMHAVMAFANGQSFAPDFEGEEPEHDDDDEGEEDEVALAREQVGAVDDEDEVMDEE